MAGRTAEPLRISHELACEVEQLTRRPSLPQRTVQRARIVCLAYEGLANAEIARQLGVCETTAVKWRRRMEEQQSLAALDDVHRSGRPAEVPLEVRCTVIKLACDRPKDVPFRDVRRLRRWPRRLLRRRDGC